MKNHSNRPNLLYFSALACLFLPPVAHGDEVALASGSVGLTVGDGSSSAANPSYKVASFGIAGEATYTGSVASVSGNVLTFETSTDSDAATINPFTPNALAAGVAYLKAAFSGGKVTGITDADGDSISVSNTESSGLDNANPPTITIEDPDDTGEDVATATATVSGGKITGITVTNQGSGYTSEPSVTVDCGPHVLRLTAGSGDQGRCFLITANTGTTVTVDNPNSENLSAIFTSDATVEILRASTLGELFGVSSASPLQTGTPSTADYVYLWSQSRGFFVNYFHFGGNGSFSKGWYDRTSIFSGAKNDLVIYPDEAFVIARRTGSEINLSFEGYAVTTDQKLQLPASGAQYLMNNPFGTDMFLCELISSADISSNSSGANWTKKFKTGTTANDGADGDNIFLLAGSTWKKYWYETGVNDAITKVATASAKAGSGADNALTTADVSLDSGSVTGLETCDSSGNTGGVDHNVSEYTKVSIGGTVPAVGFTISFSDVRGRKLNENGDMELDENGTEVSSPNGLDIESSISGSFQVVATGAGFVVVKKRRNVNFVSAGSTPTWSTGDGGAGYGQNAKAYFIGGGGTGGEGTASVSGGKVTGITVTSGGSGYTSAPQVVIAPGGWRKEGAAGAVQDGALIEGGILIVRNHPTGVLSYLDAGNPLD